jgi:hypothetical protein
MIAAVLVLLIAADAQPIFDGSTLNGWRWTDDGSSSVQPSWEAGGGILRTSKKGVEVYLLTKEVFTDFEFDFEWKAERGANSGIKYRMQSFGKSPSGRIEPTGLEFQITDDIVNPDALSTPRHTAGAIYDYVAPEKPRPATAEDWHTGRIVARGLHIEHWIDGVRVVNVDLDSPFAEAEFAKSTRRSKTMLRKQEKRESPLALQYHDGEVQFRNLRVRRLDERSGALLLKGQ